MYVCIGICMGGGVCVMCVGHIYGVYCVCVCVYICMEWCVCMKNMMECCVYIVMFFMGDSVCVCVSVVCIYVWGGVCMYTHVSHLPEKSGSGWALWIYVL